MLRDSSEHYDALRARYPDDVKILLTRDGLKLFRPSYGQLEPAPGPEALGRIEIKRAHESDTGLSSRTIEGYATRYSKSHEARDGGIETFAPGCFDRSLACGKKIRLLLDHDPNKLVATTGDRLQIISDKNGLAFRSSLPTTAEGMAAWSKVFGKGYCGMSIGCHYVVDRKMTISGCDVRVVLDAELLELSLVEKGAVKEAFCIVATGSKGKLHQGETAAVLRAGEEVWAKSADERRRDRLMEIIRNWPGINAGDSR